MAELVYVKVFLETGDVRAWSSSRGRMDLGTATMENMFDKLVPQEAYAKVIIHLIGDDAQVGDLQRAGLIESSKRAGYCVTRFETGSELDPEEAFQLLMIPFT